MWDNYCRDISGSTILGHNSATCVFFFMSSVRDMPGADRGPSGKPRKQSSPEPECGEDRMVTEEEREELLGDAVAFKQRHEKPFRILYETEWNE